MAWEGKQVAKFLEGLSLLKRQRSSSRSQDKPRKDMAGWAWHCTSCVCYNFGYRTACFRCREPQGNAKLFKTPGPAGKSGSPAPRIPPQRAHNRQGNRLEAT
eukprot:5503332-Amphidinium_carterae.1